MKWLSSRSQLAMGLISMQISIQCFAMLLGLVPEQHTAQVKSRADLCEMLAVVSSQYIGLGQANELSQLLASVVERNDQVLSAAIRSADGKLIQEIGDHQTNWTLTGERSSENELQVPILAGSDRWGTVELRCVTLRDSGLLGMLLHPWVRMCIFIAGISGIVYFIYLGKMLRHLDPSKAVPKRVRAALDSLAEGLLVIDRNGRIVLANQAFSDWVEKHPEKLVGHSANHFAWIREEESTTPQATFPWDEALVAGKPLAGIIMGLSHPNRPTRMLKTNASPVLGHDGKFGGVLISFNDITALEETRKDLKVAKDTAEGAQKMAEEANMAKSEFLARMSHEIRTPMNAILGYAEVLRNGFDEAITDRLNYLDTIHASGEHLLALINDILDLSKIESGKMDLLLDRHSLRDLIAQVHSTMQMTADAKGIALVLEKRSLVPETILTDAVRFRQALLNLVGNAVKFTSEGDVRIAIGMQGSVLRIDVIDTGIGIAPEALTKVFERFTQANSAVSSRFGGTGLGLSIARQLAQKMGGDITATSVQGKGSTFTMLINPGSLSGIALVDPTLRTQSSCIAESNVRQLRLPPCRILIADDEQANRNLAGIYIARAGGKFLNAEDGQKAIDVAMKERPDVILMDFQMPVLDGIEATKRLRASGCTIPIIALTANVMQDDEATARAAGCTGFLRKPIRMADLINELNAALRSSDFEPQGASGGLVLSASPTDAESPLNVAPSSDRFNDGARPSSDELGYKANRFTSLLEDLTKHFGAPVMNSPSTKLDDSPIESSLPTDDPEICDIVREFIPRLRTRVAEMRHHFEVGNLNKVKDHAHWLAGSGETVGLGLFTLPARELEAVAKRNETENINALLTQIENITKRVVMPKPLQELAASR